MQSCIVESKGVKVAEQHFPISKKMHHFKKEIGFVQGTKMQLGGVGSGNGRIQNLNSLKGGNSGSNGGSGQNKGVGPMGEKHKPPDIPKVVDITQTGGTLPEKKMGSGFLGEGSSRGSNPREETLENGKESRKWSSLFGTKPSGKSSLPPVKNISDPSDGKFAIFIPDLVLSYNINSMSNSLVDKFMGSGPNIKVVKAYVKWKWTLKGNIEISALPKGLLSFTFSCEEDKLRILCGRSWMVGKTALVHWKWHPNLNMNDSLLAQVPFLVKLPGLPLKY